MMNASHTIGSKLAGVASQSLNLDQMFVLAGIVQILIVGGVYLINLRETRQKLGDGFQTAETTDSAAS